MINCPMCGVAITIVDAWAVDNSTIVIECTTCKYTHRFDYRKSYSIEEEE